MIDDIFFADGTKLVPEEKNRRNRQPDAYTDQKKPTIGGISNQQNHHYGRGDQQTRSTFKEGGSGGLRTGLHPTYSKTLRKTECVLLMRRRSFRGRRQRSHRLARISDLGYRLRQRLFQSDRQHLIHSIHEVQLHLVAEILWYLG